MLIPAIALGSMMLVFLYLAFFSKPATSPAEERLARLGSGETTKSTEVKASGWERFRETLREQVSNFVAIFGRVQTEGGEVEGGVRQRLVEAGFRSPNSMSIYMGSRIVLPVVFTLLSLLVSASFGQTPTFATLMLPAMLGYVLPGLVVDRTRKRRQESIERGLADAIDLMLICIEAGLGLRATLERVGTELEDREPVIATEFTAAVAEAGAGRGLFRALRSMADRTANKQLDTLVSLLIQTDRFGTPVTDTLRMQGDSIRFARMQRAEEAAQKAPIKMLGPSMLIFVAILIVVGGPAMMNLSGALGGGG